MISFMNASFHTFHSSRKVENVLKINLEWRDLHIKHLCSSFIPMILKCEVSLKCASTAQWLRHWTTVLPRIRAAALGRVWVKKIEISKFSFFTHSRAAALEWNCGSWVGENQKVIATFLFIFSENVDHCDN